MTDDGRLLTLGALALVALAGGAVRRGSRLNPTPWTRSQHRDRYRIDCVVLTRETEDWSLRSDADLSMLASAPNLREAKNAVHSAAEFGRKVMRKEGYLMRELAPNGTQSRSSPYEVWVWAVDSASEDPTAIREFVAGYEDDLLTATLRQFIEERWGKQRVSFRTFAPPQDSP